MINEKMLTPTCATRSIRLTSENPSHCAVEEHSHNRAKKDVERGMNFFF
jgi:hypothetical protein